MRKRMASASQAGDDANQGRLRPEEAAYCGRPLKNRTNEIDENDLPYQIANLTDQKDSVDTFFFAIIL